MSPRRPPVFAGNWKMHHGPSATRSFFAEFLPLCPPDPERRIVFFPPALSLAAAREACSARSDLGFGLQNVFWEAEGAYTGEMSAPLAADAGATVALVGHSERRQRFGETVDETVLKCLAVLAAGLEVILCVGETLDEREQGRAEEVVRGQLEPVLRALPGESSGRWMVAYEPVWAIGTGRTATPEDAQRMHAFVRERLGRAPSARDVPILYGGSVKPDNSAALLACADVDGVLVGGASLQPLAFAQICTGGA